jgi:Omp85 superfamily domain
LGEVGEVCEHGGGRNGAADCLQPRLPITVSRRPEGGTGPAFRRKTLDDSRPSRARNSGGLRTAGLPFGQMNASRRTCILALALLGGLTAAPARAQDSATVVVGPEYEAGPLRTLLWGSNYRRLWTRPVRLPVLDPDTFAGGLTPLRAGGDFASNTLHMMGADGRRYVFRSIDKDVGKGLGPEFQGTIVEWIVQDQVSASHPAAPALAAPLQRAAGVLHAPPRMGVMADRPSLAACRERFAGLVGFIEERADENDPEDDEAEEDEPDSTGDPAEQGADPLRASCGAPPPRPVDGPGFAGADVVKGTDGFLDDLEDSPTNRLDSRAFLAARLVDIFIGDWDRHEDQWRWAGYDRGDLRVWRPIPRDRDNAFVDHRGVVLSSLRGVFVRMVPFGAGYPSLTGLTVQAEPLDRRLLSDLPRSAWDSVAAQVQGRLTDRAIDEAVAALPPEYQAGEPERMARILRARRDRLAGQAAEFYRRLAVNPDIFATDAAEVAVIDRHPDGSIDVTITGAGDRERRFVTFRRRFMPGETDDIRLYMQGGDDTVRVRGPGRGVGIRVVGGGGDDVLEDHTRSTGVAFYDHRGDNRFVRGGATKVSERDWQQPVDTSSITGRRTYRDWGWSSSKLSPSVDWRRGAGLVLLVGPAMTRYGFRRKPHAWQAQARVGWAPAETRFTVESDGDLYPENRRHWLSYQAYASQLENERFFGYGNDTPRTGPSSLYDTWLRQVRVEPALNFPVYGGSLAIGPVFQWTDAEVEPGTPLEAAAPVGTERYTQLGVRAELEADGRRGASFPRRGWRVEAGGSVYPGVVEEEGGFGEAHVTGAAYLSAGAGPVLALRAGGKQVWGDGPFFESAFLGGAGTLRGHTGQRFAGDAMAFGGAELRVPLFRANLGLRGTLGVIGLADAGRVWVDGESAGDWHSAVGGGLFFAAAGQAAFVTVASGERTSLDFGIGMPF